MRSRSTATLWGLASAVFCSAPACADLIVELGDFSFAPGGFATVPLQLRGDLTGWTISFEYQGNSDGSWSADAAFAVLAPNGNGVEAGGRTLPFGFERIGDVGKESGQQGVFTHFFEDLEDLEVAGEGLWTLFIGNGWEGGYQTSSYLNVVFTLHGVDPIPATGALPLIVVAGLFCRGRRRRHD